MERNKHGAGPSKRGGKAKSMAPLHGDLIALGAKGGSRMDMEGKHSSASQMKPGCTMLAKSDKKIEPGGTSLLKKPKSQLGLAGVGRPSADRQASRPAVETEAWQSVAVELPPSTDLVTAVAESDFLRAEALVCGAVRQLHLQRAKPEPALTVSLLLLAKTQPQAFCSETALAAVCSLLRRDAAASFKSKGNPQVQVLAANLIYSVFREEARWKEAFVRVYLDDAAGDRLWVDSDECKPFVENVLTAFGTRVSPKSMLQPDITLSSRPDCPSPPGASSSSSAPGNDDDDSMGFSIVLDQKSGHTIMPRYETQQERIRAMVLEAVKEYIGQRKQPIETVTRNILRLLASVCGIPEVRQRVVSRLEVWLHNPKWSRPAQELLVSLCTNLTTHTQFDIDVIVQLVRFRLKAKPIVNLYINCMRELLSAHPDNMSTLLKHTVYNELSPTRNPHNMVVLGAVFQHSSHQAATVLAEVFLELLMNKDDYYMRALRPLWREICRSLRYEVDFYKFCSGLFQDRKDAAFHEFEFRERYVASVCDLVALSALLAITPAVKEAASSRPGEKRDTAVLAAYQAQVSLIQRDAIVWLHMSVPDMTVKNWPEFPHCVYKVLFMEPAEAYYKHDNWPLENERAVMIRVASEVPVQQDSLLRVLLIGLSKTHAMPPANALEVADTLVRRSAQTQLSPDAPARALQLDKLEILDVLFNLTVYQQPERMSLPEGYVIPQLAIQERYWRVWGILLIICAHNPATFGKVAWEHYDTLKMLMEMCITSSFKFPPPTMASGERAEEARTKELQLAAIEGRQILEYESHLAAASTGQTINEANSLLLTQLITLNPSGPCRRPPTSVLEQLAQVNTQLRLGQLLCTSREPDFLLDILHRQGPNQSMPWLSDLVENNEGAFSVLPVQCLCEFLLTQSVGTVEEDAGPARPPTQAKHQQLLSHLQRLVRYPSQDQRAHVELVEYFLRRLSSPQRQARLQAAKGFELVLLPPDVTSSEGEEPYSWLLRHLPAVPNFAHLRQGAIHGLRIACHYETEPGLVGAYIQFLATHGAADPLPELTETVVDLAQLVVERANIVAALLPGEPRAPAATRVTLAAMLHIFNTYMQQAGEPEGVYGWPEGADLVVVRWPSGRTATINTLVVHATVILLTFHPGSERQLFDQLLELWFPTSGPVPRALDGSPLYPDWLKLRMVRSTCARLVDAALADLEPAQLVLFIQSFGVPVSSMTKLLRALDAAVAADRSAVAGAVMNKEYMAQLVEVQHQRGAQGGRQFADILDTDQEKKSPEATLELPAPARPSPVAISRPVTALAPSQVLWFVSELFSDPSDTHQDTHQDQLRSLQRCISMEAREVGRLVTRATIAALRQLLSYDGDGRDRDFLSQLHARPTAACCLLRLLTAVIRPDSPLSADLLAVCETIVAGSSGQSSPLATICQNYRRQQRRAPAATRRPTAAAALTEQQLVSLISGTSPERMEATVRRLVDESMSSGRTRHLVAAVSRCLLQHNSAAPDSASADEPAKMELCDEDASMTPLTQGQVGLLVDWLELLDPEIISSCPDIQLQMLFARRGGAERCGKPSNRAFLLALLTHQASWETLHRTIDVLLGDECRRYDSTIVLDFLWACLYVPRLWQGQDKSAGQDDRRQESAEILRLDVSQMVSLVRHVVSEMVDECGVDVRSRLPLLLRCCHRRRPLVSAAVVHLLATRAGGGAAADAAERLLLQLYLQLPHIISLLSDDVDFLQSQAVDGGVSVLDPLSHTLLTAIGATRPGKEWTNTMRDFEISLRKMAATHPVVFLRQLPMMASLLRGRTHLDGSVFRIRNHATLFAKLLGVLELLQPHCYLSQYRAALTDILDSYCHMFELHQYKEVTIMVSRIVVILNNFMSHAASDASKFLNKYSDLISVLSSRYPDQPMLRTLAACVSSAGGGPTPMPARPDPAASPAQLAALMMKLNCAESSDELAAVLQDLEILASRRVGVLDQFVDDLCDLLSSSGASVRQLAHELVLRHLQQTPTAAHRCVSAYFECLDSGDECVRAMVLDRLPEIVVLAQEYASQLLQKAFDVAISTNVNTASYISDAMALLNVQTGA